jgi:hypothetical protein
MYFADFKRLAITTLIGHQLDNGSWFNDPICTIASIEALCEELSGPDPACTSSQLYRYLHPESDFRRSVSPRGAQGPHLGGAWPDEASLIHEAVGHALWFRHDLSFFEHHVDESSAWVAAKWLRLSVVADPDYQLGFRNGWDTLMRFETNEPWLLAQIGLAALHSDLSWGFYGGLEAETKVAFVRRAHDLHDLASDGHWRGFSVTPEEATAIVGAFLFHECLLHLCDSQKIDVDIRAQRDRACSWMLSRQSRKGSWADSPHVTAQCLMFLDAVLLGLPFNDVRISAISAAIREGQAYLVSSESQDEWTELRDYRQLTVLTCLLRLSKRVGDLRAALERLDIDGSRFAQKCSFHTGVRTWPSQSVLLRTSRRRESAYGLRSGTSIMEMMS